MLIKIISDLHGTESSSKYFLSSNGFLKLLPGFSTTKELLLIDLKFRTLKLVNFLFYVLYIGPV